jgi:hypothetical protein
VEVHQLLTSLERFLSVNSYLPQVATSLKGGGASALLTTRERFLTKSYLPQVATDLLGGDASVAHNSVTRILASGRE